MTRTEAQGQAQAQAQVQRAGMQPLRDDVIGADTLMRPLASFAPELVDGFFVVPAVAVREAEGQ